MWKKLLATDAGLSGLVLRLALGLVMFPHGAQKLMGWFGGSGFTATIEHFAGMGIPSLLGFAVVFTEFFGSLLLIIGVLTRVWALGFGILMTVAVFMVHWQNGFFMNWFGQKNGEGFEYHILAAAMAIALLITGGGALSVDRILSQPQVSRPNNPPS